jgi:ribose transport system substrate-binding protein
MAALMVVVVSACSGGGATTVPATATPAAATATPAGATGTPAAATATPAASATAAGGKTYAIGYSNGGGVGNGFREEQMCTARAQALASGRVSKITVTSRNTDAAGQLQDIRDLIAKGVNAIVFNPNDPAALNPALAEAKAAGIATVSVDAYVTDPATYNLYNNQIEYAKLGAKWLFEKLGGKGTVYYMRGLAGHPADSDRHKGFLEVLKDYPNIKVLPNNDGVATGWDPATTTKLANEFIASGQYDTIQGIWTSGMDSQVVDVTNTAAVGGAGVTLAIKLLDGETIKTDAPQTVLLKPVAVDNTTDAGKATLKSWQSVPGMDPLWPLGIKIDGWTTYTAEQVVPKAGGCKGPGE